MTNKRKRHKNATARSRKGEEESINEHIKNAIQARYIADTGENIEL